MPSRLTNAPASFQRALNVVLTKHMPETCLFYPNDIITYSNIIGDHIDEVENMLTNLRHVSTRLKLRKCKLRSTGVEYFRHIIKPRKLKN